MGNKKIHLKSKMPEYLVLAYISSIIMYSEYFFLLEEKGCSNDYLIILLFLLTGFGILIIKAVKSCNNWKK